MAYASTELDLRQTASDERRLELFRGVVRSLARDVALILNELRFSDKLSPAQAAQRLDVARHYLDYLSRLCDGLV